MVVIASNPYPCSPNNIIMSSILSNCRRNLCTNSKRPSLFAIYLCTIVHANFLKKNNTNVLKKKKQGDTFDTIVFYLLGFDLICHSTYLAVRQTWFQQKWIRHTWLFNILGIGFHLLDWILLNCFWHDWVEPTVLYDCMYRVRLK